MTHEHLLNQWYECGAHASMLSKYQHFYIRYTNTRLGWQCWLFNLNRSSFYFTW